MARGRKNLAALAGLLGAGVLASRGTNLGPRDEDLEDVDVRGANFIQRFDNPNRKVTPSELRGVRRRAFAEEPSLRNVVQTGDVYPVQTEDGSFLKFGFAKGGKVNSASKRADGIAQRGKTRGHLK
jgi:hypothetical protein